MVIENGVITGVKIGGADTVYPFNSGFKIIKLGSGGGSTTLSINVSNYPGYKDFTVEKNFWQKITASYAQIFPPYNRDLGNGGISYNPSTGIVTGTPCYKYNYASLSSYTREAYGQTMYDLYLIY